MRSPAQRGQHARGMDGVARFAQNRPVELNGGVSADHDGAGLVARRYVLGLRTRQTDHVGQRVLPRELGLVDVGGVDDERESKGGQQLASPRGARCEYQSTGLNHRSRRRPQHRATVVSDRRGRRDSHREGVPVVDRSYVHV